MARKFRKRVGGDKQCQGRSVRVGRKIILLIKRIFKDSLKDTHKIMRRKIVDKNIRKVYRRAGSYAVTIPMEMIKSLNIREGQKVVFSKKGKNIVISDWPASAR
jgi:hypothetical protein